MNQIHVNTKGNSGAGIFPPRVGLVSRALSKLERIFQTQNLMTPISPGLQPGGRGRDRGAAVSKAFQPEAQTVEIETVPEDKRRLHPGLKSGVNGSLFARYEICKLGQAQRPRPPDT